MRIVVEQDTRLRLEMGEDGFEIVSEGGALSPYHLLAASLASCTALAVASWAEEAGIDTGPLVLAVSWELAPDRPKRVLRIEQTLRWPGLPASRLRTVERLAALCPIDATLRDGTRVERRVQAE